MKIVKTVKVNNQIYRILKEKYRGERYYLIQKKVFILWIIPIWVFVTHNDVSTSIHTPPFELCNDPLYLSKKGLKHF